VKRPADGTTTIHVRFRGGQTTTLTTVNPKASCEKVKTPSDTVASVDTQNRPVMDTAKPAR
jgi:hypothetical protein